MHSFKCAEEKVLTKEKLIPTGLRSQLWFYLFVLIDGLFEDPDVILEYTEWKV